ncbi:MAG TPA: hypothetical protein VGM83_16395 [Devosiaceae bacterium]|jgi:hypothetical protein
MTMRDEVRKILRSDWDPVGIKFEPLAQTEYDAYVSLIHDMVTNGQTADQLFEMLDELEGEMGILVGNDTTRRAAAEKLRALGA